MNKTFRTIAVYSLAGGVLLSGALAAAPAVHAATAQAVPVNAPLTAVPIKAKLVQVSTKIITSDSPYLEASVEVPVVSGLQDEHYQMQLNDIMERNAAKGLAEWEDKAEQAAAKAEADGYPFHPYRYTVKYEVKSAGELLSLVVTQEGAGVGTSRPVQGFFNVWNKEQAERATLADWFGDDYEAVINEQVKEQLAAEPDKYFADQFKGIAHEQGFYIKDGEAVVVFPKYTIAPGASGTP